MFSKSNLFFLSSLSRIISLAVNKYEVKISNFSVFTPVMNSNISPVKASLQGRIMLLHTPPAKSLNWNIQYFRSVSNYFIFKTL